MIHASAISVFGTNHDGPIGQGNEVNGVMVVMLVGYEDQIRRQIIAFPSIRIDVDHFVSLGDEAQGSVPLVKKFCHDPIITSFSMEKGLMVWLGVLVF